MSIATGSIFDRLWPCPTVSAKCCAVFLPFGFVEETVGLQFYHTRRNTAVFVACSEIRRRFPTFQSYFCVKVCIRSQNTFARVDFPDEFVHLLLSWHCPQLFHRSQESWKGFWHCERVDPLFGYRFVPWIVVLCLFSVWASFFVRLLAFVGLSSIML